MTTLSFSRRSALRLIAAAFAVRPKIGLSLFEDADEVKDVHSAVLEHTQKHFEERLEEDHERAKAMRKVYKKMREPEKVNFELLVVAGETSCTCWLADSGPFYARGPMDSAELAEHDRLHHHLQPSFTVSKPYVVAASKVLEPAYQNRRAYSDKYWQFEEEYPGNGGTYFRLGPVRFNQKRTFAISEASYRCSAGFIQASPGLWRRSGAHQWEPHCYTGAPSLDELLDELGFPGSTEQGLLARLATEEMVRDLQARSKRCWERKLVSARCPKQWKVSDVSS